jgi:hypothetical protein
MGVQTEVDRLDTGKRISFEFLVQFLENVNFFAQIHFKFTKSANMSQTEILK